MCNIIVSPHFDDAALSAWSIIDNKKVKIITICAGTPSLNCSISTSDKKCGFKSPQEAAKIRKTEDIKFCNSLKINSTYLSEVDHPYSKNTSLVELENKISNLLSSEDTIYIPLGIGQHPDHVKHRNAIINLKKHIKFNLVFYADLPYASMKNNKNDIYNWDYAHKDIYRLGIKSTILTKIDISSTLISNKISYLKYYKSQINMLLGYYPTLFKKNGALSCEFFWKAV